MPIKENNRVIVRVWTSADYKPHPGHSVGHVSIETPDSYISLWPIPFTKAQIDEYRKANTLTQNYLKYFMERNANYHQSYNDDYLAEAKRAPQITLCFYSLNLNKIKDEFERLKDSTKSWRLIGSNRFVETLEDAVVNIGTNLKLFAEEPRNNKESCASLALKILNAGQIKDLVNSREYSTLTTKTSSFVKPDHIADFLKKAKEQELKKFPETEGFIFKDETNIELKETNRMCSIF